MLSSIDLSCVRSLVGLLGIIAAGQPIPAGFFLPSFMQRSTPCLPAIAWGRCRMCQAFCPEGFRPRPGPLGEQGVCELCLTLGRVGSGLRSLDRECAAYDHLLGLLLLAESYALLVTTGPQSDRIALHPVSPVPASSDSDAELRILPTTLFRADGIPA